MKLRLLLLMSCLWGWVTGMEAQTAGWPDSREEGTTQRTRKCSVNFGAKGGFTSTLSLVSQLTVDGEPVGQEQNSYRLGYSGALFMRINLDRHFIQPEISYNLNRCYISFEKPTADDTAPQEATIESSIHSIDLPILYGYNFIKQDPYCFAVFAGPRLRYLWNHKSKTTFQNFDQQEIVESLYPICFSATVGVAVVISRIFFDCRYDVGLHNITRKLSYYPTLENPATRTSTQADGQLSLRRRENVLSFSFGIFF